MNRSVQTLVLASSMLTAIAAQNIQPKNFGTLQQFNQPLSQYEFVTVVRQDSTEEKEYKKHKEEYSIKGTIEALENYLKLFPNGKYVTQARKDIAELKKVKNHVVISAVYSDHRNARDNFSAYMNQMDKMVVPTNIYLSLWNRLNYWSNKELSCYVSGVSNNHLSHIISDIPQKYTWIFLEVDKYDNSTSFKISTPGTKTTWTDKQFNFYNADLGTLNALDLPKFAVVERINNSAIDRSLLQNKFNDFFESIKYSDQLDYIEKILAQRKRATELAEAGKFDEALQLAKAIESDGDKATALANVAKFLAIAGQQNTAQSTFNDALTIANSMSTPKEKVVLLSVIASYHGQAGMTLQADSIFAEATKVANTVYNTTEKTVMLEIIKAAKKDMTTTK